MTFSRIDNLRQHCAVRHAQTKALNASTIAAVLQQHKATNNDTASEMQRYAKQADLSLGIKIQPPNSPASAVGSTRSKRVAEQTLDKLIAEPSSSKGIRKRAHPTDEGGANLDKQLRRKKPRRKSPKPSPAFTSSANTTGGGNSKRGSCRPSSVPSPKPQAPSRFSSVRRATPSVGLANSPFTPEIDSPATPMDRRPSHLVKVCRLTQPKAAACRLILAGLCTPFLAGQIVRSRDTGGTSDSPFSIPRRALAPLCLNENLNARDQLSLQRTSPASVPAIKSPSQRSLSSGLGQDFTLQHFDEMKHANVSSIVPEAKEVRRPVLCDERTTASAPLQPAPALSNGFTSRRKPAAPSGPRRTSTEMSLPRPAPVPLSFASRLSYGASYPSRQPLPPRGFALPHQVMADRLGSGQGLWGEGSYTTDYSLSSARTRMSSGVSHGRETSSAGYVGGGSWATATGLSRENWTAHPRPYALSCEPAPYSGRTVHSPEKSRTTPQMRLTRDRSSSQTSLMDLAIDKPRSRPIPSSLPSQSEHLASPQGVLWGDATQAGPDEVDHPPDCPWQGDLEDPSFAHAYQSHTGPSLTAPIFSTLRPGLRYELASSPPPPPPPARWFAPCQPMAFVASPHAWSSQPLPAPPIPYAHYYASPAVDYYPPHLSHDHQSLANGWQALSGGRTLPATSPHDPVGTSPITTANLGPPPGDHVLDIGRSSLHARRTMSATGRASVNSERIDSASASTLHPSFSNALQARRPQVEFLLSPATGDALAAEMTGPQGNFSDPMQNPSLLPAAGSDVSLHSTSASVFANRVAGLHLPLAPGAF